MVDRNANVLLIYTGGTIGMVENLETGGLEPFNFSHLKLNMPEINKLNFNVDIHLFDPPLDSSDISTENWIGMVKVIEENYYNYDGFVILHGTDTMAYTASAVSLMIENLTKPIIFTGSQLPIGKLRTDGKENLITALEIAADKNSQGLPEVPEVCIYLQNLLMRGSRTTKVNVDNFSAFASPNYPYLSEAGVNIRYEEKLILKPNHEQSLQFHYNLDENVTILRLFPGIKKEAVDAVLNIPGLKGLIIQTFGSGNGPHQTWFIESLQKAIARGIVIVNVTQCMYGSVEMSRYEAGQHLAKLGIISGYDITTEAALAKLMILFGNTDSVDNVKSSMSQSLRGEITIR